MFKKRVVPLVESIGGPPFLTVMFSRMKVLMLWEKQFEKEWGELGLSFTLSLILTKTAKGRYVDTSRANFKMTMDISCYSLTAICQRFAL